ncbi:response regulator [Ktedonosporobacter rubrisoli]|uniref:histidine kinase n=1 Tax=Ktedonosporobacter rubrisoli TaxID=2509675 RepID=A0A4P6JJV6_KTERU|nr:ATP-binding protein [Ktedonosporobacter rubrisoli]QBD75323.1 response regulator [Ktedonosporobacter rubrisoli]
MEVRPTKVLLIEDDEDDYILLQRVLAKIPGAHYEVIWEASYEASLPHMLAGGHDLCMIDYLLGPNNGIELLREARKQGYALPIILLTGMNTGQIDIQALQAGADDYIAKSQLGGELLHRVIRFAIERKKAEHERENLLREQIASKELEKRKNEFISMVTHELKTPLTSLKGFAQLLHRRFARGEDEKAAMLTAHMDKQIKKLTDLINDLSDVTRIEGGTFQFREDNFDFDTLVKEIVEELQLTSESHTLRIEGSTHASVWGDQERIGQVIINFLTNAMKYAPDTDLILIKAYADAQTVTLCVQDFGPGISQEQQERIFDPFYRIEEAAQAAKSGLGLGLYIAAEIIHRQAGQIWVESEEGKGATFCFRLPRNREQLAPHT